MDLTAHGDKCARVPEDADLGGHPGTRGVKPGARV